MSIIARHSIRAAGRRFLRCFLADAAGATAIEYALIASGISIAIAAAVVGLGSSVLGMFSSVLTSLK